MRAMTVRGPVEAEELGVVSPHEHVLIDLTYRWAAPPDPDLRAIAEAPLTMDRLGVARRNTGLIRDNLVLDDEALAASGLREFKAAGLQPDRVPLARHQTLGHPQSLLPRVRRPRRLGRGRPRLFRPPARPRQGPLRALPHPHGHDRRRGT